LIVTKIYKNSVRNLGFPLKNLVPQNTKILARFLTTLRFDNEYIWTAT